MRIFRLILDIALLQRGPQTLPASSGLAGAALASYVGVGLLAHQMILPDVNPVGPVLFDLFLLVGFVLSLLYGRGFSGRSRQTLAALGGVGTLLTLVSLPVIRMLDAADASAALAAAGVISWLGLMAWSLLVTAYILRHALSTTFPLGMLLAIAYMMVSIFFHSMLFGTAR